MAQLSAMRDPTGETRASWVTRSPSYARCCPRGLFLSSQPENWADQHGWIAWGSQDLGKDNVIYTDDRLFMTLKSRRTCYLQQHGWTRRTLDWVKQDRHRRTNSVWFHFYVELGKVEHIKADSGSCRGQSVEEMRRCWSKCLTGCISFGSLYITCFSYLESAKRVDLKYSHHTQWWLWEVMNLLISVMMAIISQWKEG